MGIIVLIKRIWLLCLLLRFVRWRNFKDLLLICGVKRVMMSYWGLVWRQEFALTRSAWCRLVSFGMWKRKTLFSRCLLRKISKQILFEGGKILTDFQENAFSVCRLVVFFYFFFFFQVYQFCGFVCFYSKQFQMMILVFVVFNPIFTMIHSSWVIF